MAQAAELDPPLELPDELPVLELPVLELLLELLVLPVELDADGVLEPVDSLGVLPLDVLSEDVDELRESLR